jgi:hypothetical protein
VGPAAPVAQGGAFAVTVDIASVNDLYGFQFDLNFDPTLLSFTGGTSTEGSFLTTGGSTFFIGGADNGSGAVTNTADSLIGAIPGVSGDGILATFDFTAIGAGTSALSIDPTTLTLLDSSFNTIAATTVDGSVTVSAPTSAPEPATLGLLGLGLFGTVLARRKRAR